MKYWLLGRNYIDPVRAMEFAIQYHVGKRKDGITPEFEHQLSMAHFARVYEKTLLFPAETFTTIFLHDVEEDYNVSREEIEKEFGSAELPVWLLTKEYHGVKKDLKEYYDRISEDPIASVGKGCDRIHNIQSMVNVFTKKGQEWYIEETMTYILPMLKRLAIDSLNKRQYMKI